MNALSRILARFTFLRCLVLALVSPVAAHAAGLNDTGITDCWNDTGVAASSVAADTGTHPRQDCRYGRDAAAAAGSLAKTGAGGKGFDFTKIANNGSVLPASAVLGSGATDWACTRDNVTGLIWEVKTTSGLRSQSHSYTWYDAIHTNNNGGSAGTASGGNCFATGHCDTEKFVQDVNAAGLCGANDWRMPNVKELEGIADLERGDPAIDPTFFPNTSSFFWSGSRYAGSPSAYNSGFAWVVDFANGFSSYGYRNYGNAVRLVRFGQ